jgi:hypothetical protein
VSLILVDVPRHLFVSTSPIETHVWNRLVGDYMMHVFDFVDKFLACDGAILLFHHDNLCVLREIRSFLESYSF